MTVTRAYMRQYYASRVDAARKFLGGKCVECGATENLEFDHKDPSLKIKNVTQLALKSSSAFWAEVMKCQLLCTTCHRAKSSKECVDVREHGTLTMYRYCKCGECRRARRTYLANYRLTHPRKK